MGLFKSKEEKEKANEEKMRQWLAERSLEDLSSSDFKQVQRIKTQLWGTTFTSGLSYLGVTDIKDLVRNTDSLLVGISEQNWLLVKQNDQLIKQNEEIISLLKKQKE